MIKTTNQKEIQIDNAKLFYKDIYKELVVNNILLSTKTSFQEIDIVETSQFGKTLFIDQVIQSTAFDEALYHQALVNPAMTAHPCPKKILVLGAGEGASLREILKYPSVTSIDAIEIDEEANSLFQKYLPEWHKGSFQSKKVNLIFTDAFDYLQNTSKTYDIIFVDVCDFEDSEIAAKIYGSQTISFMKKVLNPNGFIVSQYGGSIFPTNTNPSFISTMEKIFSHIYLYLQIIPSFGDLQWGFLVGSSSENTKLKAYDMKPFLSI